MAFLRSSTSILTGESVRLPSSVCSSATAAGLAAHLDDQRRTSIYSTALIEDLPFDLFLQSLASLRTPAGDVLLRAAKSQVTIGIFGDYDVDGISAATVMTYALASVRCGDPDRVCREWQNGGLAAHALVDNIIPLVPERTEGYGLTLARIKLFAELGVGLLVCCDNGTSSVDLIRTATALGMQVVILDHHLPSSEALAFWQQESDGAYINNPWLAGPLAEAVSGWSSGAQTCACALSFLATCEIFSRLGFDFDHLNEIIVLAGLASVTDMMPLTGVNRALVRQALVLLDAGIGPASLLILRDKMLEKAGIEGHAKAFDWQSCAVDSHIFGFQIGPRINACGRLGSASEALQFLLASKSSAAASLQRLDALNESRKGLEQSWAEVAHRLIRRLLLDAKSGLIGPSRLPKLHNVHVDGSSRSPRLWLVENSFCLFAAADLPEGLAGLLAGRLATASGLPSVALGLRQQSDDTRWVGSGRVPDGCVLGRACSASDLILSAVTESGGAGGGHAAAFGLRLARLQDLDVYADLADLAAAIGQALAAGFETAMANGFAIAEDAVLADADLSISVAQGVEAAAALKALAPFGIGAREPAVHVSLPPMQIIPIGKTGAVRLEDPSNKAMSFVGFGDILGGSEGDSALSELRSHGGGVIGQLRQSYYGRGRFGRASASWNGPRPELVIRDIVREDV